VYLLLGLVWTLGYVLVFAFEPSAFPAIDPTDDAAGIYASLQYFSFVTLTTLGYGDITPVGLVARQLAMAEAIVGQLFIAVAIAWLVGMYRGDRDRRDALSEEADDHEHS
jgi:nicotinamide riboside transporter PnuC